MPDTAPQEQQTRSSASDLAAAVEYLEERAELYQRQAVNQVLNGKPRDAALWEEEATAIRTVLAALSSLGDGDDSARDAQVLADWIRGDTRVTPMRVRAVLVRYPESVSGGRDAE